MSQPSIATFYAKRTLPAMWNIAARRDFKDMERQINEVLATVPSSGSEYNADKCYEWINWNDRFHGTFPDSNDVIAFVKAGNCEGTLLVIAAGLSDPSGDNHSYHQVCSIKYLGDEDMVYVAARAVSKALENGQYRSEEMINDDMRRMKENNIIDTSKAA